MHLFDARGQRVELDFIGEVPTPGAATRAGLPAVGAGVAAPELASTIAAAVAGVFELRAEPVVRAAWAPVRRERIEPPPAVFRERSTGLVRMTHRELIVRFRKGLSAAKRRKLLGSPGLEVRRKNSLVPDQVVVVDRKREAPELLEMCNRWVESEDVVFATPNFVSEYRREARQRYTPPRDQWHLKNLGLARGQTKGEDVDAVEAWKTTIGRPAVVVAVLDDGVDVDHPNLRSRIWRNPDASAPDLQGRDFFLPDDHPDHYNPRPKQFTYPYDQMRGNDIHGTPCAGVIAAAGEGAFGIAFRCRVLPVKIFHADQLAQDERVADAIRYAALRAGVISCSWSGPRSTDVELAVDDAGRLGRDGRGSAVFAASGNSDGPVGFPAAYDGAIAVGASTDQAERAPYSNYGPQLDVVAPSSGGVEAIFTTDVANPPGRGFNLGDVGRGGRDGLHTSEFGGTSSATPLAAGVAGLALSVAPDLSREELGALLRETADKIGDPAEYGADGRSDLFGYGRVNAARAVQEASRPGGRAVRAPTARRRPAARRPRRTGRKPRRQPRRRSE